ncbi:GTP-binding protein [Nocardioides sp. CFH 31398]|uniref:CobW family GTP-binding protein n=1 Tax=Nocardioides sp. CFH 31398 TaxID=2919579 RepID=UPI001F06EC5F|nr:GTP-binding protein [Nocardioides sp. CFH 31398]MCH1865787.1 GTP-binding protein [Nocardioides sp. CFH 31398]
MRTPVVLLAGVAPEPMTSATLALQLDLPDAVVVRHHIDPLEGTLERVVSDAHGIVERNLTELEHTCVSCALREDVLPTLHRLAGEKRWGAIVSHLPVSAEPVQICEVLLRDPRLARRLRVASVLTALTGPHVLTDLLGDDILAERNLHTAHDDERGVAEVACSMVEYADAVVLCDGSGPDEATGLVRALARPEVPVVTDPTLLDAGLLVGHLHDHEATGCWTKTLKTVPHDAHVDAGLWRLDLRSERPFHPGRLLEDLEVLGSGHHRSRGTFHLPSRTGQLLEWDGAGGQLSIGREGPYLRRTLGTRLILTGLGRRPDHLADEFQRLLVQPGEETAFKGAGEDGFEPWLGPTRAVA